MDRKAEEEPIAELMPIRLAQVGPPQRPKACSLGGR